MRRRLPLTIIGAMAITALAALISGHERVGTALSKMRTDFVALRCLDEAVAAVAAPPLDRQRAVRKLTRALQLAPDDPVILAAAGPIYATAGEYELAARQLMGRKPVDPLLLGQCLLKQGLEEQGAKLLLQEAEYAKARLRSQTSHEDPFAEQAYALQMNNVGYLLADAGVELERAKAMVTIATDTFPVSAICIDSLGWVHYRLGDYRKAVLYLERAVRLQSRPGDAELYYHLGAAYVRRGRLNQAKKALDAALTLDPQHEDTLRELTSLKWRLPGPALARRFPPSAGHTLTGAVADNTHVGR